MIPIKDNYAKLYNFLFFPWKNIRVMEKRTNAGLPYNFTQGHVDIHETNGCYENNRNNIN